MRNTNGNMTPRTMLGFALIVGAVLLFFNNIGFKIIGVILSHWPIGLIVAGGVMLNRAKQERAERMPVLAYVLVVVGVLFLLAKYRVVGMSMGALIGPLLLLAVGFYLVRQHHDIGRFFSRGPSQSQASVYEERGLEKYHAREDGNSAEALDGENCDGGYYQEEEAVSRKVHSRKIDVISILGGGDFRSRSQDLRGGVVVTILGGADIDIREADTDREVIEIDVLAFMGGVEIKVPPHWEVTSKVLPVLGGVSNKTTCLADKLGMPRKHLVVTGLSLMGGVDIRN